MSSPIVYLGLSHSGKELFYKLCLQNNYKCVFARNDQQVSVSFPRSKSEFYRKRYVADTSGELHVFEKIQFIKLPWEHRLDQRIKEPPKYDEFEVGKLKTHQIIKLIRENIDSHAFIIAPHIDQVFPIMMIPHFRKCRIVIPYRKHRFKKQLWQYLNEGYQMGFTKSFDVGFEKCLEYLDNYLCEYEECIRVLNQHDLQYELVDMSDPDMYKKLGLNSDHLEFDYENHVFTTGDPGWEKLAKDYDLIKLSFDYVDHYIETRKDRITSLFPDIVL